MDTSPNERTTRQQVIDQQLAHAGWSATKRTLIEELPLARNIPQLGEQREAYQNTTEYADYALLGRDGAPLAIVEAKRGSRDALAGKRQAADYADYIKQGYGRDPFIFLCNGETIWFWDRERAAPRVVSGFFTRDDLERLAFQRQQRQLLAQVAPRSQIVDREYQYEAIRRVSESLEAGQRTALLVMATGTGKTRTVVALIDLLMRAKWVQRVLFLADRRELVRQALDDFKEHMPDEPRARIEGGDVDHTARIHVATYPSMLQVFQDLSPGYYDLVVADESHRSIYHRYRAILDYFDAIQIGLTATPVDHIDRNTFELFHCPNGLPTFAYQYQEAVQEGYLVDYRVLEAQTSFQIAGIKAGQLPVEIQQQLIEQGIELSEIDFDGTDLEKRVTNSGTNDAIIGEFMEHCRKDSSGTLPAKSIIFAMSHQHAVALWQSFNRLYPDMQRRGLAEIIDSYMERADKLLDDFKRRDLPRVAITVDMLDTGIDIPAIQNLVFARPVFSWVKFWQMIGRGTRLWANPETGEVKRDFLIIDHWNNFAYFGIKPQGEIAPPSEALPVRLFRLRLEKLLLLRGADDQAAYERTAAQLRAMLTRLPSDNTHIHAYLQHIEGLLQPSAWASLSQTKIDVLATDIAPLMRFLPEINHAVMSFEVRAERLAIAYLSGQADRVELVRAKIVEDLSLLPTSLREIQAQAGKLAWVQSDTFWNSLNVERIDDLQATFAPLMRYRQRRRRAMIELHLPDTVVQRRWMIYGPGGEGAFVESYRERAEAQVRALSDVLPALIKLRQGQPIDEHDMAEIAAALDRADLFITADTLREAFQRPDVELLALLRHVLGLAELPSREQHIAAAFAAFIAARPYLTATQIHFLRAVRSAVLRRTQLTTGDLAQLPFSRIGAVRRLFSEAQIEEILSFANELAA